MIVEAITHGLATQGHGTRCYYYRRACTWSLIWQQDNRIVYSWLIQLIESAESIFIFLPAPHSVTYEHGHFMPVQI